MALPPEKCQADLEIENLIEIDHLDPINSIQVIIPTIPPTIHQDPDSITTIIESSPPPIRLEATSEDKLKVDTHCKEIYKAEEYKEDYREETTKLPPPPMELEDK